MTLFLLIIVFLLLSAFFSGSEIAFVTANKLGIEVIKNKGNSRGKIIAGFYDKPREFLSSLLVGNNITLVILTIIFTSILNPFLSPYLGEGSLSLLLIVTLIITVFVLIFGEFIPKTLFRLYSNEVLMKMAYPLRFTMWFLYIPTWIMTLLSNLFLKYILKAPMKNVEEALSKIDLEEFIHDNVSEEEDIDKEILTNALNFGQLKVRDCYVPRNEIISIDASDTIEDLIEIFKLHKISRVIVLDGDIENVKGYIHHQQLLSNPKKLDNLIIPIAFVPDAMSLYELMSKFIKEQNNIACVVDEFGSVAGLITLEDILEEIFGEIEDEHDHEALIDVKISDDEYLFAGRLEIDLINEKYPLLNIPEGDYQTLSGYIVLSEGNIPEKGEEVELHGLKFILEEVSDTRIEKVRVLRMYNETLPKSDEL